MANIKSAKKRIKVSERRKDENRVKKSTLSTAIKKFRAMVAKKELKEAETFLPEVYSLIDSGASHGRLHKNNASRKKARLALMLEKAKRPEVEVKVEKEVKVAKKPVEKVAVVEEKVAPVVEVVEEKKAKTTTAKKTTTTTKKPAEAKTATTAKKPATKKTDAEKAPAKTTTAKKTTTKKEA